MKNNKNIKILWIY